MDLFKRPKCIVGVITLHVFITNCPADLNQWNEDAVTTITDGRQLSNLT